jgi:hypothetical protein
MSPNSPLSPTSRQALQDLPLESYVVAHNRLDGRLENFKSPRSILRPGKRSVASPGSFLSPAKRRLLGQADLDYHMSSPDSAPPRTPSSHCSPNSPLASSGLRGSSQLSRKLTFAEPSTPKQESTLEIAPAPKLAPSPILKEAQITQSVLSTHIQSHGNSRTGNAIYDMGSSPSWGISSLAATSSIHYPGFATYVDPHLQPTSLARNGGSADDGEESDKENLPTRRRAKKLSLALGEKDVQAALSGGHF